MNNLNEYEPIEPNNPSDTNSSLLGDNHESILVHKPIRKIKDKQKANELRHMQYLLECARDTNDFAERAANFY